MSILKKSNNNEERDDEWNIEVNGYQGWFKATFLFLGELIKTVIISLAIILPVRYFVIQPFYVKGASMEPSFYDNEYLIVNELVYRLKEPERGDIVIFKNPRNEKEFFIKRLIGLPGETIKIYDHKIYIYNKEHEDGVIVEEPYLLENENTIGNDIWKLNEFEYFVLGDNRDRSLDSRNFGSIERKAIIGKVLLRGWPLDRATLFKGQEYNL